MNRKWGGTLFYLLLLLVLVGGIALFRPVSQTAEDISYTQLVKSIQEDEIKRIDIKDTNILAETKKDKTVRAELPEVAKADFYDLYLKDKVEAGEVEVVGHANTNASNSAMSYLPSLILMGLFGFMIFSFLKSSQGAGGRMMNFGKSKAHLVKEDEHKVNFSQVAGLEEEKEELGEIVDFLKNPKKFISMGARIPKGVLLVGPPGTGKTYLSKAVAGEADVPFYTMSGSDFVEMYVGVGASRVRDLFETAKKNAPCIIFIDEIDAVGRRRGAGVGGGHDEREQTLNQLLVEMDGFGTNEGVIVMAATNRADILDPAILRPGRFDRTVYVGLPDVRGREEVLKIHAKDKPLAEDANLKVIAKRTPGFTPADLENLMNEAALLAARRNEAKIQMDDIDEASIKVQAGPAKKSRVVSEKERKLTAVHEVGHALVSRLMPGHDPVHMITIIPRGMAGGFTAYIPEEDTYFRTKSEMEDNLVSLLGGRVAEALVLDDISTGASNDIERATKIARDMVTKFGMSSNLGTLTYGEDEDAVFMGRDFSAGRGYSEEVASEIDHEMRAIVNEAYGRSENFLKENMDLLLTISDTLLERETLSGEEFEILFNGGKLPPLTEEDTQDDHIEREELSDVAKEIADEKGIYDKERSLKEEKVDDLKDRKDSVDPF